MANSLTQDPIVTSIIIGVFQEMQDNERRPKILELRKKWGCDELTQDEAKEIVSRVTDAAKNGVSLSLTTEETKLLYSYMLHVETHHTLQAMNSRRMSNWR